MTLSRLIPACCLLLAGVALLGGCPAVAPDGGFQGVAAEPDGQSADDTPDGDVLGEFVSNLAETDSGNELASSESSDSVTIGSDSYPEGVYPPGYNPYAQDGDTGGDQGPGDGSGGDAGGGGGAAASGGGGSDNSATTQLYVGNVACVRSEALSGYGGYSENLTYYVGLNLNDGGVPSTIPVPMFITKNMYKAPITLPGQSDVHAEVFTPSGAAFTVTIKVRSASYSPSGMHVVFDIDTKWIGEHSGITAKGTHTVDTHMDNGHLIWSSTTQYDSNMWASDDWQGIASEDFVCQGTLHAQ